MVNAFAGKLLQRGSKIQHQFCVVKQRVIGLCLSALFGFPLSTSAQIVGEPIVHWIGPEVSAGGMLGRCDYATIQEALDDIFDCGIIFPCPLGRNELRLANDYAHSGQVVLNNTVDIVGGYSNCQGAQTGQRQLILADVSPLFVVAPGSGRTSHVLSNLQLSGNVSQSSQGGVIRVDQGQATLTLHNSEVTQGNAIAGGGIYLAGDGNHLELVASEVSSNQAIEGGGIFCTNSGTIAFQSGRIEDNVAALSGGGIHLQAQCRLTGKAPGEDRQILRNRVTDLQRGQGAGIYALFSRVELGALLSRTRIEENIIETHRLIGSQDGFKVYQLHDYDAFGDNRGGGVHLEFSDGVFYNTWFRGNEAADGGGLSVVGNGNVLVDRTSGPCDVSDTGNSPDCSLFEFNRARGGTDGDGDEGGDGAAVFAQTLGDLSNVDVVRTTIRSNLASCFEGTPPGFTGECNLDQFTNRITSTNIIQGIDLLGGVLLYDNDIGDDEDCRPFPLSNLCFKEGHYVAATDLVVDSTITDNSDADGVYWGFGPIDSERTRPRIPISLVNSIVYDFEADQAGENFRLSSCNVSNFADELDEEADELLLSSANVDPLFRSAQLADYRLRVPESPAIDRCDDADGLASLSYDIVGNPRPLNVGGLSNGPGERDAGAFEAIPDNFINATTDLAIEVRSALPKQTRIGDPHEFSITVNNVGRNAVDGLDVRLDFASAGATLISLIGALGFEANGDPVEVWDCDVPTASCDYRLPTLTVAGQTTPITAVFEFGIEGLRQVSAEVVNGDGSQTDLVAANNVDSDQVVVGPGADLRVVVANESGNEVAIGQQHKFAVTVINNGPENADQLQVGLDAGANGTIVSFLAPNWRCDTATATCTFDNPIFPASTSAALVAFITYAAPGTASPSAAVFATTPADPQPGDNFDSAEVTVLADGLFSDGFEAPDP